MYPMKEFRESDRGRILGFMRDYPFATVTTIGEDGWPVATHVPVIVREEGDTFFIRGHVMRKTDHWQGFKANPKVLTVFHGPNCPVLASWYPEKDNGGTWNYMVVQAHGHLTFLPQADLVEILRDLKNGFEGKSGPFEDLSEAYMAVMLPAIEAFEIRIEKLEAVFKLSQNRDDQSFANIVRNLTAKGGQSEAVAEYMRTYRPHLD